MAVPVSWISKTALKAKRAGVENVALRISYAAGIK